MVGYYPLISIFTPTHNTRFLEETWESILGQGYESWQWVIVPNNGACVPESISEDSRVKVVPFKGKPKGVGELKLFACQNCSGEIYLELDHDDILLPGCLDEVERAFRDPQVQMVYSNTVEFEYPSWKPHTYSEWWGWRKRPYRYQGHDLYENISWDVTAHCLRHIYWSPNHLRAWRSSAYHELGGHDPDHSLVDDHDLNIRTYLAYGNKGMYHIDKPLYLYRVYPENTCRSNASEIRSLDTVCYDKYIMKLAQRWAKDENLSIYDLGGSIDPQPGFVSVDKVNADIVCDLDDRWPIEDKSAGIIRASHIIEHLKDPIHTMNEMYRVLAPGGWAFIEVPSTDGRGAWQDPTHRSYWNENSFWYYTRKSHARYVPEFRGRFQVSNLKTYYPSEWWEQNNIPVVQAHLIALGEGYDEYRSGEILI
jgi:SAM-dependent methyltransferase